MNFYEEQLNDLKEKGCGKKTNFYELVRNCGQMEDLKHSNNIIYCDVCKAKQEAKKQTYLKMAKNELEFLKGYNENFIKRSFDIKRTSDRISQLQDFIKQIENGEEK